MRRIAANYFIPAEGEPVRNGYAELDDNGVIIRTGQLDKEMESTEYYNGIITPHTSGKGLILIDNIDFSTLSPTDKSTYRTII